MDIVNFFETVDGNWFSQRTTHFALGQPSQTGETTLKITRIDTSEAQVAALCEAVSAKTDDVALALLIRQEPSTSPYQSASSTPQKPTVFIGFKSQSDADTSEEGLFVSQTGQEAIVSGQYRLENEILMLTIQNDEFQSQERVWYMNPNLRMRTSLVTRADGFQMASFCSELRRLSK